MTAAMTTPVAPPGPFAGHVPYATPVPRPAAKAWAGAAIVFGGLCLILLGGCFLIGVLSIVGSSALNGSNYPAPPLSGPQALLMMAVVSVLHGLWHAVESRPGEGSGFRVQGSGQKDQGPPPGDEG